MHKLWILRTKVESTYIVVFIPHTCPQHVKLALVVITMQALTKALCMRHWQLVVSEA